VPAAEPIKARIPVEGGPLQWEQVWLEPVDGEVASYRLQNIPVLVYNVTLEDSVLLRPADDGGSPIVTTVIARGPFLSVGLVLARGVDQLAVAEFTLRVTEMGGQIERYGASLWAVAVNLERSGDTLVRLLKASTPAVVRSFSLLSDSHVPVPCTEFGDLIVEMN